jgi:hypothetical protein
MLQTLGRESRKTKRLVVILHAHISVQNNKSNHVQKSSVTEERRKYDDNRGVEERERNDVLKIRVTLRDKLGFITQNKPSHFIQLTPLAKSFLLFRNNKNDFTGFAL